MAQLMADCDLVIGAAGSTSWERCCLGVPSIMVVLADNQRVLAKSLVESGSALFAGSAAELQEKLPKAFRLAADTHVLNAMSLSSRVVLDGAGAIRVVSELLDSSREQH
jgi:spore coat polysaccharide biosynthesis predicted glycosyltransferase SpsG